MKTTTLKLASLFTAILGVQQFGYSQLTTLNTGVASNGSGPLAYNSLEQNYSVYYSSSFVSNPSVSASPWLAIASPTTGGWIANPPNARWLSPITASDYAAQNFDPAVSDASGYFYFVGVAGFNGEFSGGFASDNPSALFINGNLMANSPGWASQSDQTDYGQLWNVDVTIHQGDSIEWVVDNTPGGISNPAGLLVTGTVTIVPEPVSAAFLGLGLTAMAILRRRQR